ncbi:TATA element modulatory factor 1 TATA binding protein [Scenedesmus sp. NREL 46B-D3]|nr:TATA element modulatory factor 1 TATA binding protein [Scenedesmus sp. NREL 46B-D3]
MRQVAARLGSGSVGEATLQRLRAALRQKAGECAALEGRLHELEATRDQLAGELVAATHAAEKATDAVRDLPKLRQAYQELQARYAAAVELVGERDEQLEELANDLEDVKQVYRQQIETLLAQQQ